MIAAGAMTNSDATPLAMPEIPDKLYFRIGEVARLVGVPHSVLRYWETEFPAVSPKKSGTGHRLYRRKDVELLLEIKQLLYGKRFTIEGARRHMESREKPAKRDRSAVRADRQGDLFVPPAGAWQEIRKELQALLDTLK
jgi:DNA-binding transcriptional MerR regulator